MTEFEKKQPNAVFVEAGRKAANMLIDISNNPYTTQPHKTLWEKGWRLGLRFTAGYVPYPKGTPRGVVKHAKWQDVRRGPNTDAHRKRVTAVVTESLVSKFNSRNQTAR